MLRFVAVALVLVAMAAAVDHSKFKRCSDIGFCRRNRKLASSTLPSPYIVSSPFTADGLSKKATILNRADNVEHTLRVTSFDDNIWRVRIEEANPVRQRFDPAPLVISPEFLDKSREREISVTEKGRVVLTSSSKGSSVSIDPTTAAMTVLLGDKAVVELNERGLLSLEHTRGKDLPIEPTPSASEWKMTDITDGGGEERFQSYTDSKPYGPQAVAMDITLHSAHVYGLPEHTTDFDLPSTLPPGGSSSEPLREPYRFYNLDVFEYELDETMGLYGAIPLIVSHNEHNTVGVLWLNAAETWVDVAKNTEQQTTHTHWISETGYIDIFVFLGPSPAQMFLQLSKVTGTQELPPLFSIAYHQCRWNYRDEQDVAQVDAGFDSHDIPMDVLWLDIEHTDGKRYFTWDKGAFPSPARMQQNLEKKGRKMVTIVDPHIKRDHDYHVHKEAEAAGYYVKNKEGNSFDGWCWPGSSSWLDYLNPTVQDYWASLYSYDKYEGSTPTLFTWNDMNEPSVFNGPEVTMQKDNLHYGDVEHREVHNMYGALNQKSSKEGLIRRNTPPNERPFVLTRAFFVGSQRYGAVWTGDNAGEWGHLRAAQPMLLSLSVAGYPFAGADVGGFFGNPEPELLLRWYQAGAFQPFFRGHAHHDSKRREPWLFGDPWTSHIRKAIRTRYSYLPYWYTLFHEASVTGLPVMRPLWVEFPADTSVFGVQEMFMVGPALLVHPIVEAGRSSAKVALPGTRNHWYDVETYEAHTGPATIHVDAPLEKIPVFQRGGTIVPKRERARRSSSQMKWDPYTLVVAVDIHGRAQGSLYVDDGHTYDYKHEAYMTVKFDFANNVLTATPNVLRLPDPNIVEKVVVMGIPASKVTQVNLHDGGTSSSLTFFATPTDALVIRKPFVPLSRPWSISIL